MKSLTLLFYFTLSMSFLFSQKLITKVSIQNDTSFNTKDSITPILPNYGNWITNATFQKDNKIVVLSASNIISPEANETILRINTNGSIDTTFKGGIFGSMNNPYIYGASSCAIQSDNKIILVGSFGSYNGIKAYGIIRINSDGSIDNTFNSGFGFDQAPTNVVIQSDDKIIVQGRFSSYNGFSLIDGLVRLNNDGTIDTSFHYVHHIIIKNPNYFNTWKSIFILPNDKLLVTADKSVYNNDSIPSTILRLNNDGTDDSSFNTIKDSSNSIVNLKIDGNGNIISIWGINIVPNGYSLITHLKKYFRNGVMDNTFDTTFKLAANSYPSLIRSICITNNGKIITANSYSTGNTGSIGYVFNSNGTYDSVGTKKISGFGLTRYPAISVVLPTLNNKIIFLGQFFKYNNTIVDGAAMLNGNDFSLDGNYNLYTKGGANGDVYTQIILPNDEAFVGGSFTHFNGIEVNHIVKLQKDGNIDSSFHFSKGFNNNVYSVCADNDKIIVGGDFTAKDTTSISRMCRLNVDGSIDSTFNVSAGFNNRVNTIAKQQDGKYLIGGDFVTYNNSYAGRLIRLNTDGSIDNTFNIGTGVDSTVKTIYIQPDGKILIGGSFSKFNNSIVGSLIRLNTDGSVDNLSQRFLGTINTIAYQTDNKFIIGGSNLDGHNTSVFRCNHSGTLDTTLKSPYNSSQTGIINSINLLNNGLIVMGGNSSSMNTPIFFVYVNDSLNPSQLRSDTTRTFNYVFQNRTNGYPAAIFSISQDSDNKIVIGGQYNWFYSFAGITVYIKYTSNILRNNISRLILNEYYQHTSIPIRLLDFVAYSKNNETIELNWTTASETNNKQFIILRSIDGIMFDSIGTVLGSINSNTNINYQYSDKKPSIGINYYKLRQVDIDGKFEDSKIISALILSNIDEIKISPNPFTTQLNIQASNLNKIYNVSLINIEGTRIANFEGTISTINSNINRIIPNVSKGLYLLIFKSNNQLLGSYKILKE